MKPADQSRAWMNISATGFLKNGIWLTLPPLVISLGLMWIAPNALTPAEFNRGIPPVLLTAEMYGRFLVFAMPATFHVGLATRTQKWGLVIYLAGVGVYGLTYGTQNYFPDSAWSQSMFGFTASAATNLVWMAGLGLLGSAFYVPVRLRFSPAYYILPASLFILLHVTHAILFFRLSTLSRRCALDESCATRSPAHPPP